MKSALWAKSINFLINFIVVHILPQKYKHIHEKTIENTQLCCEKSPMEARNQLTIVD